jgi:hypothetical protein
MATGDYPMELPTRDDRWVVLIVLAAVALVVSSRRRMAVAPGLSTPGPAVERAFLVAFCFVAFVLWAAVFAYSRYLAPVEVLSGTVAAVSIASITSRDRGRVGALVATMLVVVIPLQITRFSVVAWRDDFFPRASSPLLRQTNLLVVLPTDGFLAYLAPSLPEDARMVQVPSVFASSKRSIGPYREDREIAELLRNQRGPIVAATRETETVEAHQVLALYGLGIAVGDCEVISTPYGPASICPVSRRPARLEIVSR